MHDQKEKNRLSQSWLKENDPTSFNYSVYGEDDPSEKKKTTKKERGISQCAKEKRKIIHELGGKCNRCGITDTRVLDAHHIIPEWKTHKSNLQDLKINHRENNIEVLCCNCHRIKHIEMKDKKIDYNKFPSYQSFPEEIKKLKEIELKEKIESF